MKLYIPEYSEIHRGKSMTFAAREGVLRDNIAPIVSDLRMLTRIQVSITLIHNIPPNPRNVRFLHDAILSRLPEINLMRVKQEGTFYEEILEHVGKRDKLIYLERQALEDQSERKINAISTKELERKLRQAGKMGDGDVPFFDSLKVGNVNLRHFLEMVCQKVHKKEIRRVHFVPINNDHAIRNELFSIDGVGTIIEDDFSEPTITPATEDEVDIIFGIFEIHKKEKYLKPRSKEYIREHLSSFYVAHIDRIPVGCVEIKEIDPTTYELAGLAVIKTFLSLRIGSRLIKLVEKHALSDGKGLVCITPNPELQKGLLKNGYTEDLTGQYRWRAEQSPYAKLFVKDFFH